MELKILLTMKCKYGKKKKERDEISFEEIIQQQEMEHKENMEKEVIKVIKTKENIIWDAAEWRTGGWSFWNRKTHSQVVSLDLEKEDLVLRTY